MNLIRNLKKYVDIKRESYVNAKLEEDSKKNEFYVSGNNNNVIGTSTGKTTQTQLSIESNIQIWKTKIYNSLLEDEIDPELAQEYTDYVAEAIKDLGSETDQETKKRKFKDLCSRARDKLPYALNTLSVILNIGKTLGLY